MTRLKIALRALLAAPSVTAIAIASLALGIGATVAIFSLFNQILIRPLPVPEPDRLVNLAAPGPKPGSQSCSNAGNCDSVFSYLMFRDLEREQDTFSGIAAHVAFSANLAYRGQTISARGLLVSGSYLSRPRRDTSPGAPSFSCRWRNHRGIPCRGPRPRLLARPF